MADLLANLVVALATFSLILVAGIGVCSLVEEEPDPGHKPGLIPTLHYRLGTFLRRNVNLLALALAALVGFGVGAAIMAPRSLDPDAAQACTRITATLLTTRDVVELERSRYLVGELGCSIRNALPAAEAAADVVTGLPRPSAAQPGMGAGDFLLHALVVTVTFVGGTIGFIWLFGLLATRKPEDT